MESICSRWLTLIAEYVLGVSWSLDEIPAEAVSLGTHSHPTYVSPQAVWVSSEYDERWLQDQASQENKGERTKQKYVTLSWLSLVSNISFLPYSSYSGLKGGDIDSSSEREWKVSSRICEMGAISEVILERYNLQHSLMWNLSLLCSNSQNYFWKTTAHFSCVF